MELLLVQGWGDQHISEGRGEESSREQKIKDVSKENNWCNKSLRQRIKIKSTYLRVSLCKEKGAGLPKR